MATPGAKPVTTPAVDTVPFAGVALLHTPPAVASLSVILRLPQTLEGPVIGAGAGLTTMLAVAGHPVPAI